jgi:hypothetical protein
MYNNAFPIHPHKPPTHKPPTTMPDRQITTTQKWATFTYPGKETTFMTNLFKKTDLKLALQNNNTIQRLLMHKQVSDIYTQSGVYKLTCPDCKKAYVGQNGRSFTARFKENINAFKTNSPTSNFAKHLIKQTHSFNSIHNTTQILQRHNKGAHLNTIERYYIYVEYTNNNHLNDEHTIFTNKIFGVLLNPTSHKPTPHPNPLFRSSHTKPTTPTQALPPTR